MHSKDHISCREVVELVSDYLEGALPVETSSVFEEHLNFCEGCASYVNQMRDVVKVAQRVREEDVPPEVRDQLLAAFRHWRGS